ncbi:hypothetical protein J6590_011233 [Homalodisca vitripennis]|nr:hypothetical protein J6590_011233 [Homalodisca vitripennis]
MPLNRNVSDIPENRRSEYSADTCLCAGARRPACTRAQNPAALTASGVTLAIKYQIRQDLIRQLTGLNTAKLGRQMLYDVFRSQIILACRASLAFLVLHQMMVNTNPQSRFHPDNRFQWSIPHFHQIGLCE